MARTPEGIERRREQKRRFYAENREKERARRRATYDPAKQAERNAKRRAKHPEYGATWRSENPERARAYTVKWREAHPDAVRAMYQARSAFRRARRAGVPIVERVRREVVFERDDWVCGICGESIDPALRRPDPMSPSIDHIVPLIHGGEHSYANCQAAHLGCNTRKRRRGWSA